MNGGYRECMESKWRSPKEAREIATDISKAPRWVVSSAWWLPNPVGTPAIALVSTTSLTQTPSRTTLRCAKEPGRGQVAWWLSVRGWSHWLDSKNTWTITELRICTGMQRRFRQMLLKRRIPYRLSESYKRAEKCDGQFFGGKYVSAAVPTG